ncbi:hypothetical protein FDP41_004113 [Naegleria fowleri]|uniref:Uncharacterized protein n=1 Tax=Naegleria fowleri TaxID=5763 RepID=A0A6A5BRQ7_NAEFO|nr:uncharacterized protein FDP41_004113 [Naegleria fowleri]KAF0976818.1 hypothetical protein FDP41_004113 [Naegleria fowleri]
MPFPIDSCKNKQETNTSLKNLSLTPPKDFAFVQVSFMKESNASTCLLANPFQQPLSQDLTLVEYRNATVSTVSKSHQSRHGCTSSLSSMHGPKISSEAEPSSSYNTSSKRYRRRRIQVPVFHWTLKKQIHSTAGEISHADSPQKAGEHSHNQLPQYKREWTSEKASKEAEKVPEGTLSKRKESSQEALSLKNSPSNVMILPKRRRRTSVFTIHELLDPSIH